MSAIMTLVGHLPFWVLYGLADVAFVLVYYVVRYRRGLVTRNLAAAFPAMTAAGLRSTRRRFYRNLCDYFFETAKLASVSDNAMRRRMTFTNPGMIDGLLDRQRSVAVYFSHCFNWEWAPSVTLWSRHREDSGVRFCQVYRPLANRGFDEWFLKVRSRFGSVSLAKRNVLRELLHMRRDGLLTVTGFMSDQKVSHLDTVISMPFMGRPTEVISGTEVLAAKLDMAAVYWDIERTGRGRYRITTRMLAENPSELPAGELTRRYISMLESTIRRDPSNWLWSHNRWKRVIHPVNHTK